MVSAVIMTAKPGTDAFKAQEEIVGRELIADGDARGDDKRWLMVHRSLLDLMQAKSDELSTELTDEQKEETAARDRASLAKLRLNSEAAALDMKRTLLQAQANQRQVGAYDIVSAKIDEQMESARRQIEECQVELTAAKLQRRHRQEYELMANMIREHPDRTELHAKIAVVDDEIKQMDAQRTRLMSRIDVAKKRFYTLGVLIKNMQQDEEETEVAFDDLDSTITMASLKPTNAKATKKNGTTADTFGPKPPPTTAVVDEPAKKAPAKVVTKSAETMDTS